MPDLTQDQAEILVIELAQRGYIVDLAVFASGIVVRVTGLTDAVAEPRRIKVRVIWKKDQTPIHEEELLAIDWDDALAQSIALHPEFSADLDVDIRPINPGDSI